MADDSAHTAEPARDWWQTSVTRDGILEAIRLLRQSDRDATLRKHGFREANDYVVVYEGFESVVRHRLRSGSSRRSSAE